MQGSCLCGAIEFRVEDIYPKAYQCHCSLCRKQGGASSSLAIIVEARNFSWITGREHISSYVRPTAFVLTSAPDAVLLWRVSVT
jgi:hypothetical protein